MGLMSMNGHLRECLLANKSAQLSPQLSLGFSMNFILIKKYICTMTTKKGLMVKCTPERGHNALFFIPLQVFIML